jgi:hypothetical protein
MVSKAEPRYELSQRQIETIITATWASLKPVAPRYRKIEL